MIKIPQGFKIASKEVVDTRLVMSKAEMLTVSDAVMPEVYFRKKEIKLWLLILNNFLIFKV